MRIAFVIPGGAGGGARSVTRLAKGLLERGHTVRLFYPRRSRRFHELVRDAWLNLRYKRRQSWLQAVSESVQAYTVLTAEIVGRNDVVVGVGVECVLAIARLPPQCGIKVHNCRGIEPWAMDRMLRAWQLPMPRIVNGSHLVRLMREHGSGDPIFVAHNGVDRSAYFPCVAPEERDGVGTVYHGSGAKDPALILSTLRTIRVCSPKTPLYVFGSYPRPRGLPRMTTYTRYPPLAVARNLYSRSLVWFLASRCEGLPNPLLEAMACGCAVVSTDCGGPSDIVQDGVNGFLVPVGEPKPLGGRILELLRDADTRGRFLRASESTLDRFTWEEGIRQFETALQSIAQPADRGPDSQYDAVAACE